jgi:hypothetical protein
VVDELAEGDVVASERGHVLSVGYVSPLKRKLLRLLLSVWI